MMYQTYLKREKVQLLLQLFFPILIYQFANYSATFVDATMTGHYATIDLAGVSMALNIWNPLFTFLTGIVSALVPILGHHLGQGKKEKVAQDFYQFLYLTLGLALSLFLAVTFLAPILLGNLGLDQAVETIANHYLAYLTSGILPLLVFSVIRSFFDALGRTKLSMYLMLLLLPLNSFFNLVFIYGKFGFPELGGAGAGLETSLAYWTLLAISILVLIKHPALQEFHLRQRIPIKLDLIKEDLKLGLPIGGMVFLEVAIFSVIGLVMSQYSSLVIASHQAAMNVASLMYAFPMSISSVMAILVSYEVGAKRYQDARTYARIGRLFAIGIASLTLVFLYLFRQKIALLYGSDEHFTQLTIQFLTYSLFFQLADAFAAPLQGILRGYKDTKVPFYLGLLAYWGVTLPVGFVLSQITNLGPFAYWIGLIVSLSLSGLLYQGRLKHLLKALEKNEKSL